jgi:hypothetical protein
VLDAAVRYAGLRVRWALGTREARRDIDAERGRAHNVLIESFNILSRAMGRSGESNEWRRLLGEERRFIGDVACQLHCLLALSAA